MVLVGNEMNMTKIRVQKHYWPMTLTFLTVCCTLGAQEKAPKSQNTGSSGHCNSGTLCCFHNSLTFNSNIWILYTIARCADTSFMYARIHFRLVISEPASRCCTRHRFFFLSPQFMWHFPRAWCDVGEHFRISGLCLKLYDWEPITWTAIKNFSDSSQFCYSSPNSMRLPAPRPCTWPLRATKSFTYQFLRIDYCLQTMPPRMYRSKILRLILKISLIVFPWIKPKHRCKYTFQDDLKTCLEMYFILPVPS